MRPHGRISVNPSKPAAQAVCERCGFNYPHASLAWQFEWAGPRLQNKRLLVCPKCIDIPQEGLRTFTLPPDPVPIENPRQENCVNADNPLSPLGFDPVDNFYPPIMTSGFILGQSVLPANLGTSPRQTTYTGNLTLNGGINAAFNGTTNKPRSFCAALANSLSSFQNIVGINWAGDPSGVTTTLPSTTPVVTHVASKVVIYAPNDWPFLATGPTGYLFQGSPNNATWTTLSSGTTQGTKGEILTISSTLGASYQYHQFVLQGDGISAVAIAQLQISVSDGVNSEI